MLDIALLAFNSVFPLLALMLVGIFLRAKNMLNDGIIRQLNAITAKVFIPCLLFHNVYSADLRSTFDLSLFLLEVGCLLFISAVLFFLMPHIVQDRKKQFSFSCSLYWLNCTMFALPILTTLCGSDGMLIGTVMIVTISPLFSAGSVVFLEKYRSSGKPHIGKLLRQVFTNPMLWGSMLGTACNLLGIRLPSAVFSPIRSVANIATPLSLICLGAFCKWDHAVHLLKPALIASLVKLFVIPCFALAMGYLCGYRGLQLFGLLIIFASPSGVSTFSIAEPEFADCELSALLVSLTSLLSIASFFFWIIFSHALNLI